MGPKNLVETVAETRREWHESVGTIDQWKQMLKEGPAYMSGLIDKLIAEIDENNDGEIQFEEFCAMMKQLTI